MPSEEMHGLAPAETLEDLQPRGLAPLPTAVPEAVPSLLPNPKLSVNLEAGRSLDPEIPETGAVFTFGRSRFADNAPSKFWIKRDVITDLSCGDEHTAVATTSGRLFTFGSNEFGQLGLGHNANVLKPSCVKSLKAEGKIKVNSSSY